MSNENKSGNMNDQSGLGKNDPNRISDQPKSGQQSQGASQKNSDEIKRTGSSNDSSDQNTGNDAGQPAGSPK